MGVAAKKGIAIEPEARAEKKGVAYLECTQRCYPLMKESGRMAIVMSYDVEELFGSLCQ